MSDDLESQFNSIVDELDLDDLTDPRGNLTLWEVNRAVAGMNEAAAYLGRYMAEVLKEGISAFPTEVVPLLRQVIEATDKMSEVLSECRCADCQVEECPNCVDDESGICDECASYLEEDEE